MMVDYYIDCVLSSIQLLIGVLSIYLLFYLVKKECDYDEKKKNKEKH